MATGQKIAITITGIQYPVGADEEDAVTTVQQVEAECFQKGDSYYLFYMEQPEGFPAPLRTRLKIKNQTLEIHRQGPGGNTMCFVPGQSYRTEYSTPYGILLLDIDTLSLEVGALELGKDELNGCFPPVAVEYVLKNDGEVLARYRLSICADEA